MNKPTNSYLKGMLLKRCLLLEKRGIGKDPPGSAQNGDALYEKKSLRNEIKNREGLETLLDPKFYTDEFTL